MPAVSRDFERMVRGYGLTTAHFFYTFPDHPDIVNPNWMLLQFEDLAPEFPRLAKVVSSWSETKPGSRIVRLRVEHSRLIKPREFTNVDSEFRVH